MSRILEGKVALITGAGQGVGRGIALALANEGAQVAVVGRTMVKLERTCAEIGGRGGLAAPFACDVRDEAAVADCVTAVVDRFGTVDILINAAQEVSHGPILSITTTDMNAAIESGPMATLRFMQACHPHLKNGGSILNFGTAASIRYDSTSYGAYAAAKEAIRALSRMAAVEWGPDRIRVNCIIPLALSPALAQVVEERPEEMQAFLATVPLGHYGNCERDIGRVAVFLCGPDAGYVTGQTLPVDGGQLHMR